MNSPRPGALQDAGAVLFLHRFIARPQNRQPMTMRPEQPSAEAGFVSEPITPHAGSADAAAMARGGPGLPAAFTWRGQTLTVCALTRAWRETAPCTHGSGERYARKHWFEFVTPAGQSCRVYFERRPRGGALQRRWWLYSMRDA